MQATISPRKFRNRAFPVTGRSPGENKHAKVRTAGNVTTGFLNQTFAPLVNIEMKSLFEQAGMEKEFFNSFSHLCRLYNFKPPNFRDYPYPLNIYKGFDYAKFSLKELDPDLKILIVSNNSSKCCLTTYREIPIGYEVYYIPVEPMVCLIASKKYETECSLLLSVYAFLLQRTGIPFYLEDSYTGRCYQYLEECIESDGFGEDEMYYTILEQLKRSGFESPAFKKLIENPQLIDDLQRKTREYIPTDNSGYKIRAVAELALVLLNEYPKSDIFDSCLGNIFKDENTDDDDYDEEYREEPYHYLSFVWDFEGPLIKETLRQLTEDLQQCSSCNSPCAYQFFNKKQTEILTDLKFEKLTFALIKALCTALETIPYLQSSPDITTKIELP